MADIKRSLSIAIAINFSISLIEAASGFIAHSNSLTMDCIHNFSDVLALIFLRLWCTVSITGSRNFERLANLFNSLGIICVCSFGIWQSIDRTLQPKASTAIVSLVTGLLVLLGNGLAAKVLYHIKDESSVIRFAYFNTITDLYVSLTPVLSGILMLVTGRSFFDSLATTMMSIWLLLIICKQFFSSLNKFKFRKDAI